jgi:hypothetical protein
MAKDIFNFIKNNKKSIATMCIIVAFILIIVLILLYVIVPLFNNSNESNNNMVVYKDNILHKDNNLPTSDKSINYNVVATVQNNDLSDLEIPLRHINQDNTYNTDLKTEIQNVKFSSDIATTLNQTALNEIEIQTDNKIKTQSDNKIKTQTDNKIKTQSDNKIKTQKYNTAIDKRIGIEPYNTFSMRYVNKGPSMSFNDFYYGTRDRSCGSFIDLNPYIKKTPYEQSIIVDSTMLNDLINNRCQENKYLYLTGSVQGEKFI